MRLLNERWWTRVVLWAAIPALVLISQNSLAQEESDTQSLSLALQGAQTEDAFEKFANLQNLASAWRNLDSAAMTDCALLFAEAERVLLRSHPSIKASDVFELAIRVATEKGDKVSLGRLAKAFEQSGDKDRLAQVNLAIKAAGASRAVDPVLSEGEINVLATIQDVQAEIQSARIAGSKDQLYAIDQTLADLPINDPQRVSLKNGVQEAIESLGDDQALAKAVQHLDQLSGVVRPLVDIKEPEGGEFSLPDYSDDELSVKEQTALMSQQFELMGNTLGSGSSGLDFPTNGLSMLSKPSRSSNTQWTDQYPNGGSEEYAYSAYGVGSIFQYVNAKGPNQKRNCGQAAVATMLTYHKKYPITPNDAKGNNKLQRILEKSFPPDMPFGGGTSPSRVMSCAGNYGLNCYQGLGQSSMESWVSYKYPCILLVDVGKAGWKNPNGSEMWGLHYVVCYAYDGNNFWLTNWQGSAKVPKNKLIGNGGWVGGWFILTQPKS